MDRSGRVVIAPAYFDVRDFFHGLAAVQFPEGKWGFIDESGKLRITARFDDARDFTGDLAPVRIGRKWGYIDTSGRMAIEPQFQSAAEFHEGLARIYLWSNVACRSETFTSENAPSYAFHLLEDDQTDHPACFPQDGRFGYIDKAGKIVIPPQFFVAQDFAEGLAAVRSEEARDSKYGYIDRTGQMVIQPRFNQAGPFSEGLAAVETSARVAGNRVDDAWGFINREGAFQIPDQYDYAGGFSEGLAPVAIQRGVSEGYIDHTGKMVIPARFRDAGNFSDGLAVACSDRCVYIDRSGVAVIKNFEAWWQFVDGLAVTGARDRQFYIDHKGRVVAPYERNR